ncbi:MAG: acylphosphatase [Bacteroidales bacterium]
MKKHVRFHIRGRVQGVGFRFSCMEAAYKFNIKGFVKNNPDHKSVYVEAEGEEEDLNKFRQWCNKGPLWAKIRECREEQGELKHFTSFEILRESHQ